MKDLKFVYQSFTLWTLSLLVGCSSPSFETEEELVRFISDESNGYKKSSLINGINLELSLRPNDLLISQVLGEHKDESKIDTLKQLYGDKLYFNLSISKDEKELLTHLVANKNSFGEMVNKLSFNMGNNIFMFTDKRDTIQMIDYVYPKMYGFSKATTLLVVFPKDVNIQKSEVLNITVADFGFNTGEVRFTFDTDKILDQPILKNL